MAERERIEFMPDAIMAGIVPAEDACDPDTNEKIVVENGWAHVTITSTFGGRETLRSYPAHIVSRVVYRDD